MVMRMGSLPARICWTLILFFTTASSCCANNNYFLPGDAFFYFEIEQKEWKEFKTGKESVWTYDRPEHLPSMLCGYFGCQKIDLASLSKDYRKRFIEAVDSVRQTFPAKQVEKEFPGFGAPIKKTIEINKIRVFVYNRSFDFSQQHIGLKYNESWPDSAPASHRPHFQFDFFVNTPRGITESWRMGSLIKPLDVKLPTVGKLSSTTIEFNSDKHKLLVAPPVSFESLCFPKKNSKHRCFAISKNETQTLTVKGSRWTATSASASKAATATETPD